MKLSKLALAAAIAGMLSASTAYAQSAIWQPSSIEKTAYEYSNYYAQNDDREAGAKEEGVEGETPAQAGVPAYGDNKGDEAAPPAPATAAARCSIPAAASASNGSSSTTRA